MQTIRVKPRVTLVRDESGAAAIIFALTLTLVCGFVALAVDIGHVVMVKAELQRTADAAALGGATGFLPYNGIGSASPTPNWVAAEQKAHTIINNAANETDNVIFALTDGTVLSGYWLLTPQSGSTQLSQVRPAAANIPEPAVKVTLSKNVTLYFAPMVGVSSPQTVTATGIAILPEAYSVKNLPPIAVSWDFVYNNTGGTVYVDTSDKENIKIQSQGGLAGWFNLNGGNSVPSVRFSDPLSSTLTQIYLTPGTKATLTDLVSEGQTVVLPVVQEVDAKEYKNIIGFAAFKIDSLGANNMSGHFINQYYDPNVVPTGGTGIIGGVSGTPKLVSPIT
jgi:hypothetical protein